MSVDLSSDLLILSSVCSNLLSPSRNFSFRLLYFPTLKFHLILFFKKVNFYLFISNFLFGETLFLYFSLVLWIWFVLVL